MPEQHVKLLALMFVLAVEAMQVELDFLVFPPFFQCNGQCILKHLIAKSAYDFNDFHI